MIPTVADTLTITDIYSEILSEIFSDVLSDALPGIIPDIRSDVYSDVLFAIPTYIHSILQVRACPDGAGAHDRVHGMRSEGVKEGVAPSDLEIFTWQVGEKQNGAELLEFIDVYSLSRWFEGHILQDFGANKHGFLQIFRILQN